MSGKCQKQTQSDLEMSVCWILIVKKIGKIRQCHGKKSQIAKEKLRGMFKCQGKICENVKNNSKITEFF